MRTTTRTSYTHFGFLQFQTVVLVPARQLLNLAMRVAKVLLEGLELFAKLSNLLQRLDATDGDGERHTARDTR